MRLAAHRILDRLAGLHEAGEARVHVRVEARRAAEERALAAALPVDGEHDHHRVGARKMLRRADRAVAPVSADRHPGRRAADRAEAVAGVPVGEAARLREAAKVLRRNRAFDRERAEVAECDPGLVDRRIARDRRRKSRRATRPAEQDRRVEVGNEVARLAIGEERVSGAENHFVAAEKIEARVRIGERRRHRVGAAVFAPPLDRVAGVAGGGAWLRCRQVLEEICHRGVQAGSADRIMPISLSRSAGG